MELGDTEKLYYSISEVSDMTGVKPHILRFWEKDFTTLRPRKNRAGNRAYRERDIRIVLAIRKLLYEEGYTIKGAQDRLRKDRALVDEMTLQSGSVRRAESEKPEGLPSGANMPASDPPADAVSESEPESFSPPIPASGIPDPEQVRKVLIAIRRDLRELLRIVEGDA
jgi:DNA-binding transcriptional MerR regulator